MKGKCITSPSDEVVSPCLFPVWFNLPLIYLSFAFFSYLSEAVWVFYFLIEEKSCFLAPADWKLTEVLSAASFKRRLGLSRALDIYGEKKGLGGKKSPREKVN